MNKCLVLLSTYNGEKYLSELLNSVLNQKYVQIDILVRDDGSKDGTLKILNEYENDNIRVYCGKNLRPARSFLDLIYQAPDYYEYYAFCDQDDVWKDKKISSAIDCIKNINGPALYSGAVEVVDENLEFIRKSASDNTFSNPLYDILMYGTPGCTFVFNRELMIKLKEYQPESVSMHDSWVSFVCLAVGGQFYSDQNAYILYRQHEANVLGAQRHSFFETISAIVNYKGVLRSDMTKEILNGYSKYMSNEVREAFEEFAYYKEKLNFKVQLLRIKYDERKSSKRAFQKIKLRVLFNSL